MSEVRGYPRRPATPLGTTAAASGPVGSAPSRRRAVLLALAVLATAACSAEGPSRAGITVRDSAGIRIVENTGDGLWEEGEAWRLSERPVVEIGSVDGPPETQLFGVTDAVRLSDGRIVIANAGTGELRFFDPEGRPLFSTGGEGGGPGEFSRSYGGGLAALARAELDTLLAYDEWAHRISVFAPDGSFVRSYALDMPGEGFSNLMTPVGWLEDGTFITRAGKRPEAHGTAPGTRIRRFTEALLFYRRGGTLAHTACCFPGDETYFSISPQDESGRFTIQQISIPFLKTLEAGTGLRIVGVAPTDANEIRRYGPGGRLQSIVRLGRTPRPVREQDIEAWKAATLSGIEDTTARGRQNRAYAGLPIPETMPAFAALVLDMGGRVWLEAYDPPGGTAEAAEWSVYHPVGRLLGTVEMPRHFRPFEIGEDYVLGLWHDEIDVEHVRLYRLERPAAK